MAELKFIERSREEEEARIVRNWLQRLNSNLATEERNLLKTAMQEVGISGSDIEHRRNLTQHKLDIVLSILHEQIDDIIFRLYKDAAVLELEVLGYAVVSSRSVRKAMEVLCRFHELTSSLYDLILEDREKGFLILPVPRPGYLGSLRFIAEDNTAGIWAALQNLVEAENLLNTCEVRLDYASPSYADAYHKFFHCPVRFEAGETGIFIPHKVGEARINYSNRAMVEACSAICDRLIPKSRVREDLRRAVQRLLLSKPEKKMLKLEDAASELSLSVSQLRKGLYRLGTSYKKVALEVRMALAKHYLAETNLKIDEIAYLLDYAHGGAFSRAFKTECGFPPVDYRASTQMERVQQMNRRS